MVRGWLVAPLMLLMTAGACAQTSAKALERLDLLDRQGTSDTVIIPIFSQLVLFALPDEFRMGAATSRKSHFSQQAVLARESAARWTQMISVSGDEALAFGGRTWPQKMVDDFSARIRKTCPESFAALPLAGVFVGSYDTAVVVAGCGNAPGRGGSEATMQMVVKGGMDVYTVEWTVRGAASRGPLKLDADEWTDRIRRLAPVRLCAPVANEQPPYPSCARRR
jgi:hypothetical protein